MIKVGLNRLCLRHSGTVVGRVVRRPGRFLFCLDHFPRERSIQQVGHLDRVKERLIQLRKERTSRMAYQGVYLRSQ